MWDIFSDALIDSLIIFPIVFIVYLLIEYLERRETKKVVLKKVLIGRFSPLFGALFGVIPQCGFSIVATKFYQQGLIYLGTLIAVFVATSDEAIPILFSRALSGNVEWTKLILLVAVKFVYAVIVGFIINFIFVKKQENEAKNCDCIEEDAHQDGCCGHEIGGKAENCFKFIAHPFFHSLKIIVYIFVVNLVLGILIESVIGQDRLNQVLTGAKYFEPLICSAVGLIPNCAISVALTELYCDNLLSFSGVIAGLTANSGLGLLILFKDRKNIKKALLIALLLFVVSSVLGYITYFVG